MYFIFYQNFDDMEWFHAETIEEINDYMTENEIPKDEVMLVEGQLISGINNKHWPKGRK